MTALEDWLAVRALIADERNWCQHRSRQRHNDRWQRCVAGALWDVWARDPDGAWMRASDTVHAFYAANPGITSIGPFNDTSSHITVIAAVNRTIAYLRRQETIDQLRILPADPQDTARMAQTTRDDRMREEFLKRTRIRQGQ